MCYNIMGAILNILSGKNKEPVDMEPMSFTPQWIITDFGSPKQLIILWTTATIDDVAYWI
jgi:hypothetical protein